MFTVSVLVNIIQSFMYIVRCNEHPRTDSTMHIMLNMAYYISHCVHRAPVHEQLSVTLIPHLISLVVKISIKITKIKIDT